MTEIVDVEAEEVSTDLELRGHAAPANLFRTDDPNEVITRATEHANALAKVIQERQLFKTIQGKSHVLFEGWTLLGTMLGVFPVCVWTRKLEKPDGWEARVEAHTLAGAVVGAAESQCTRDENMWSYEPKGKGGRKLEARDDHALRSMAQTRAASKALKQALGFVVTLAGYEATPADEMPSSEGAASPTDTSAADVPAPNWPRVSELLKALEEALPTQSGQNTHAVEIRMWSESKFGKKSHELDAAEVDQVIAECEKRLADAEVPFG